MAHWVEESTLYVLHQSGESVRAECWEDDITKCYNDIGIPMTEVNNWVKDKSPIVYPLDADGRKSSTNVK